jgi:HK97 family phage major capsid protein
MSTVTASFLNKLKARRREEHAAAEAILVRCKNLGRERLNGDEDVALRAHTATMRVLDVSISDTEAELARAGSHGLKRTGGGSVNSAGRLAPLAFPDEELRRLQGAAQRGDNCRLDARAFSTAESLLPAQLFGSVVGQQHEGRLLDHLPGVAMETGSIEFIRHISTTGAPATVAEGALKPEVVMVTDALTEAARKIAAHVGISYEIAADFVAFQQYAIGELVAQIIDQENAQLLTATGTGTNMTGFYSTTGILTHDASADTGTNVTSLDSVEIAITALRTGSALATADVLVLNPADWSKLRRIKDTQGRFLTQPDPTTDEANSLWGIDVIQTTANPVGKGLLLDSTKAGYVGVREPISVRTGYANDDLVKNILRFVAEERAVLCVTRPAAVLAISNL